MSAPLELTFACPAPSCGKPVVVPLDGRVPACGACSTETPLLAAPQDGTGPFGPCPVCLSADLYAQRDFNRRLGLALAGLGLLLGPFTGWISTIVAIGLDALLWFLVPSVVVCYACNAQVRGLEKERRPPAFEIAIHDVYKFGRRSPPHPERAPAGPRAHRLRYAGDQAAGVVPGRGNPG